MSSLKQIQKTRVFTSIIIFLLFINLVGCTYGFPKGFDKEACTKKAEDVIEVVNTRNYEALHELLRTDMKENVSAEDFSNAWDGKLERLGEFEKFGNPVLSGEADVKTGDEFAMIVYYCYYKNGEAIYTIYFDKNMEMTSISMKLD